MTDPLNLLDGLVAYSDATPSLRGDYAIIEFAERVTKAEQQRLLQRLDELAERGHDALTIVYFARLIRREV